MQGTRDAERTPVHLSSFVLAFHDLTDYYYYIYVCMYALLINLAKKMYILLVGNIYMYAENIIHALKI